MRDVLRKLKPDRFEDIIALVALYRPGPMDNIPTLHRAASTAQEKPDYLHPSLEGILKETFGIMIYQEQVMQIAQMLSGYSLGSADLLRRAMGKKIKAEMEAQREDFVDGAVRNEAWTGGTAAQIFDLVDKFAGYGFNKSHAAAYALIAYQTAWLKANYPVEFYRRVDDARHRTTPTSSACSARRWSGSRSGCCRPTSIARSPGSAWKWSAEGELARPLCALRRAQCRPGCRRGDLPPSARRAGASRAWWISPIAAIRAPSTSGRWKT